MAQLHHARHPRALARAVQLLQACSQRPALLLACARSGQLSRSTNRVRNLGFCCRMPVDVGQACI